MKQIKKKYIRLTETQLNTLIKEEVKKQLQILMEYAEPRKKVVDRCANLFDQIVENWCLVHFCTLINEDINNSCSHWKQELKSHLNNIANATIKGKDNVDTRHKAIVEGFDRSDCFISTEKIYKKIYVKFSNEQIDVRHKLVHQCCQDFMEQINYIIDLLANSDIETIVEYVEKL